MEREEGEVDRGRDGEEMGGGGRGVGGEVWGGGRNN